PLKTQKTNGRGAAQDHEHRTAVRDEGSRRRSRPRRPMVEAPLKTMNTEPPFGMRGRGAAQDHEHRT
ncbi:unnamed protein product, partial [Musa textilis]